MTPEEIIESQKRYRRLSERSKTIVADLRKFTCAECHEAAEVIEWLLERNAVLDKEYDRFGRERFCSIEETEEAERKIRKACAKGRLDAMREAGDW